MSLVVATICLPLSVYESLERELRRWLHDYRQASIYVSLYPRIWDEYENTNRRQASEGMPLFAPPDIPMFEDDQNTSGGIGSFVYFTSARLTAIQELPDIQTVSWIRPASGNSDISIKGNSYQLNLITPEYFELAGIKVARGRGPLDQDPEQVAVLGERIAKTLFGDSDPIGQRIVPDSGGDEKTLTVIGVLAPVGGAYARLSEYYDQTVYIVDREPIDLPAVPLVRPEAMPITEIWVKPEMGRQGEASREIQEYLRQEVGTDTIVKILTNIEYARWVGGIQIRQAYLPHMGWVIGIVLFVAALNIGIVIYSLLHLKRYEVGVRRSLGASRLRVLTEEVIVLLPKGMLASVIGILIAFALAPILGMAVQFSQFFTPISVITGPYTVLTGLVAGMLLWCVIACVSLIAFLQCTPSELLHERNKSFACSRKGQLLSGVGLTLGVAALIIILGLKDGTIAQFDRILGWAGGERAGAVVDWQTKMDAPYEKPAELSSSDYYTLKNAIPDALFGWLGRTGGLSNTETLEASASMSTIRPPVMAAGRWFSQEEETRQVHIAVLGHEIGVQLAKERNVKVEELIGQRWQTYQIVGVMDEWPARYSMGYHSDVAYVPIGIQEEGAEYFYAGGQIAFIFPSSTSMDLFLDEIRRILSTQHPEGKPQFILAAKNVGDMLSWRMRLYMIMEMFAVVTLLIGSLGIMNLIFMWIVSRWREIGIRRAVGAERGEIARMVLTQALRITLLAAFVGGMIGTVIALFIQHRSGWALTIYPYWFAVIAGVAISTALIFGGIPAWWAAIRAPIKMLRME